MFPMRGISKVWTLVLVLMAFAGGAFGYSSVSLQGNTLGFDADGRLDCLFDAQGGLTTFEYDDAGNLFSRGDVLWIFPKPR